MAGYTETPRDLAGCPMVLGITVDFDKSRTEFMPLSAGQFSLHHTHLLHNSRPNLTDDRRIGLGISYIPTEVRCTSKTRLSAMLVCGTDVYGNFDDEPRPKVDFGDAERAAHADAVARFRASKTMKRELMRPEVDAPPTTSSSTTGTAAARACSLARRSIST
jgi:Phytanoyl-CoA dioxygenase (PhyH)